MNTKTEDIRFAELIKEVNEHPHRNELITLMYEQLKDMNDPLA
jgi:hypothetical protein